ncbi:hypothetical protein HQ447_02830 [bacterium]|nr:hypothetical protein [bacterium]
MLAAASLGLIGCEKNTFQAEWWQGELERIGLSHQVELKQYRLAHSAGGGMGELVELRDTSRANRDLLKSLRQQRDASGGELAELEKEWIDFQGVTIRDQRQRAIDDGGVTIRHADGSAKLRDADLDDRQRVFFGLEAAPAHTVEQEEFQADMAYECDMEVQMAALHAQQQRVVTSGRRSELAVLPERSRFAAQQAAAAPVVAPRRSFAETTVPSIP